MPSKVILCVNLNHLTQAQRSAVNFFGDYYIEFDMYFFI